MPGRRHVLALLAAALLGATASIVVTSGPVPSSTASIDHDAAALARSVAPSTAVAGRVARAGDQLVNGDRPHRLTGLAVVALLLVLAVQLRAGTRRLRRGRGGLAPDTTGRRITPPRAPPLLLRIAS